MADLLHCYNKGCNQKFNPKENSPQACTFHPGAPYFHDAYKEWTCCNKRSVDFTEFLNIKGCKVSFHSDVKPVLPEKPKPPVEEVKETPVMPKPREALVRPDASSAMKRLQPEVSSSLRTALAEQLNNLSVSENGQGDMKEAVKVGDQCQNRGCSKTYTGSSADHDVCLFHPGFPIFHEGMKYYSCCQRKTSEFEVFMKQEGCERGNHVWKKSKEEGKRMAHCRMDWHQTGPHVYVTFYAKNALPEKSIVEINQVKLHVKLAFDGGESEFAKEMVLGGIVDVENSIVTMTPSKVEVRMKKAEPVSWTSLEHKV